MWSEIAIVLGFIILYWELLWPYVIYNIQASQRRCGRVKMISNLPFGIFSTYRLIQALKVDRAVHRVAERELALGSNKTHWFESFFKWTLVTNEPENLKAILATQFQDFALGKRSVSLSHVFGSGIFTQDGDNWKHSRAMLRPQFSKEQISRLGDISRHVSVLVAKVSGEEVDIQKLLYLLTMDTSTEFLFGESTQSLSGKEYRVHRNGESVSSAEFVDSYRSLLQVALYRVVLGNNPVLSRDKNFKRNMQRAHLFIDHYVDVALARDPETADDKYVFSYELAKTTRDARVIRDQIFNILIAGRDTTASLLSFSMYYIAKDAEVWERIKADVWQAFPGGDQSEFTYEGLRRLRYVPRFVKEVLRLSPPVPMNLRTAVKDTTLPLGGGPLHDQPVFVPKGTLVWYSTYVMQRDPELYGATADKFDPNRWADTKTHAWAYLPFNGGPRICLGQQLALTEAYLTLCKLAHAFDKILPGADFPPELLEREALTVSIGTGVPVKFVPY